MNLGRLLSKSAYKVDFVFAKIKFNAGSEKAKLPKHDPRATVFWTNHVVAFLLYMAGGHGIHSLVGDVDAPVARVGAVADRQEVDLVVAATAPQP